MKILTTLIVIASLFGLLYSLHHVIVSLGGWLHKKREIPSHPAEKRLAVLIPARNEEDVISYLIESVRKQNYPKELFQVIAIPNNCTDNTAEVARKAGARVFSIEKKVQNKAEVLDIVFKALDKEDFDAYVIMDADNVIDKNFLQAANDALCEGFEAGQSRRESKNLRRSGVSFCSSITFYFMNTLYNRSRFNLGLSAAFSGTGVVISKNLVRKTGFSMHALTEDQEYTICCAMHDVPIAYIEKAVTYDEQPVTFKSCITQRRRWGYGVYQCFKWHSIPLLKKALREHSFVAWDFFIWNFSVVAMSVSLIPFICTIIILLHGIVTNGAWLPVLVSLATGLAYMVLGGAAFVLFIFWVSHIPMKKAFPHLFAMGLFLLICMALNLLPIVTKPPRWRQIPHTEKMTIDDMTEA